MPGLLQTRQERETLTFPEMAVAQDVKRLSGNRKVASLKPGSSSRVEVFPSKTSDPNMLFLCMVDTDVNEWMMQPFYHNGKPYYYC